MALRSTEPLKKMNTKYPSDDKGPPASKAEDLTAIYEPIV
jgi:hypothetical protein